MPVHVMLKLKPFRLFLSLNTCENYFNFLLKQAFSMCFYISIVSR